MASVRAVCYPRVSSAQQRERDTIESQRRVLPEFVARQGWDLVRQVETYIDDGRTAKAGHLDARTGFAALVRDAALGLFDVVVVMDVDRLTRSEDLAERGAILGAFQRAGVKIASVISGQVIDLSTSSGDLSASLYAFFAAEFSRKLSERVKAGKLTAIGRGRKPGGATPWWLTYDRDTGAWSIDPMRGPLIVEAFERVASGESCRRVADDFHRRGIPRPRGPWSGARVLEIIRQRVALGEYVADRRRRLTIAVPAVIDEDLWQRAQAQLAVNGRRGLRRTRHEYLLEGLAICGACGMPMGIRSAFASRRDGGRVDPAAYRCQGRRHYRLGSEPCGTPLVRVEDADARAWEAIRGELEDPGLIAEAAREVAGQAEEHDRWRADADGHRAHIDRLDQVEAAVLERFERGLISESGLDRELARLSQKRASLRAQLASAERGQAATVAVRARVDDATRTVERLRGLLGAADFATRRRLVEGLIPPGGVVFVGDVLRITLLIPRTSEAGDSPDLASGASCRTAHENRLRIRVVA